MVSWKIHQLQLGVSNSSHVSRATADALRQYGGAAHEKVRDRGERSSQIPSGDGRGGLECDQVFAVGDIVEDGDIDQLGSFRDHIGRSIRHIAGRKRSLDLTNQPDSTMCRLELNV